MPNPPPPPSVTDTLTLVLISKQQLYTRFLINTNKGNVGKKEDTHSVL